MKTYFALFLAAVLTLSMTACSVKDQPETTAATTVPAQTQETTQPAADPAEDTTEATAGETVGETVEETTEETLAPDYPAEITNQLFIEGETEDVVMDLFDGGNYVIYMPRGAWELQEEDMESGYAADIWTSVDNPSVALKVLQLGSMSPEEAYEQLVQEHPAYVFEEVEPYYYRGMDYENFDVLDLMICSNGETTFALQSELFFEALGGFGVRLKGIMDTFEIK